MRIRRLAPALFPVGLPAAGVGLLSFVVYVQTLLPGVGWGDIARFQYVARVWGIPHRFGYPLYIGLSRLFGHLPINPPLVARQATGSLPGAVAYRVNLMSAVFGALAAVVVFMIVWWLVSDWVAAAGSALSFAFSFEFWSQAVVAEVYTLNAFLIGAVVLVLLVWHRVAREAQGGRAKTGWLYLGIGLYALSFGNHLTVVTLLPAVLFMLLATDYRLFLDPRRLATLIGLVLLGASQYAYVIVRAQQRPLLNELGPFSWRGWLRWMARSRYPRQFFAFSLREQADRTRIYLELLEQQFFRWGYILGWIGAWEALTAPSSEPAGAVESGNEGRARAGLSLTGSVFLALVALGVYIFGVNYGGANVRIYLIPSYLVFAVFFGCGLSAGRKWLAGLLRRRPPWLAGTLSASLAALVLAMPLYPLWQNWAAVEQSNNTLYADMAYSFVELAGPDFVLVESGAHYDELEAIRYVAWVEKGWFTARSVTPGGIDPWLGVRPVYAWAEDPDIGPHYVQEPVPGLPAMARIVGVRW